MDFQQFNELLTKGGAITALVFVIVAILRGWLVTGREYNALRGLIEKLEKQIDADSKMRQDLRIQVEKLISESEHWRIRAQGCPCIIKESEQ